MDSAKKTKKTNSKKGKTLIKLISKSDSESEGSEHELSYYINDRVKLIKEVLKIIKPKKIKSMAPDWMKNLEIEEINSMLLEELLGISNKRLRCIFNGQKLDDDSSSTDPEEEQKPVDIISLDDISDDDFVIDLDSDNGSRQRKSRIKGKIKHEPKRKKIKKEKHDKTDENKSKPFDKGKTDQENLMSVLELLELQARARAIRSQLALENQQKAQLKENSNVKKDDSDNEPIIVESPKNIEIVITSSESEDEDFRKTNTESYDNQTATANANERGEETENELQQVLNKNGENETVLSREKSPKNIQEDSEHSLIEAEVSNKSSSVNKNSHGNCLDDEIRNKSSKFNNVTDNRDEIDNERETENISKLSENPPVDANKKLQPNIANSSKSVHTKDNGSSSDKILDKTSIRKKHKCKRRQLNKPHKSNSEDENQESSKYKKTNTEPDGVLINKEHSDMNSEMENDEGLKLSKNKELHYKNNSTDDGDGIVINVDQSEIECIISD